MRQLHNPGKRSHHLTVLKQVGCMLPPDPGSNPDHPESMDSPEEVAKLTSMCMTLGASARLTE